MADDLGIGLGNSPFASPVEAAALIEKIQRGRGTTPLGVPRGPSVARDGVRLTKRTRRMMDALAAGDNDLDDPDYLRLRMMYQRPSEEREDPPYEHFVLPVAFERTDDEAPRPPRQDASFTSLLQEAAVTTRLALRKLLTL